MKSEGDLPVYNSQVVFIFDECHRSQFGEAQKNLKKQVQELLSVWLYWHAYLPAECA